MTLAESPSPRFGERSPGLGTGEEYSRGETGDQKEFWAICRASEQLHAANDLTGAVEIALDALAGPEGLGFRRACWFAVDASGASLRCEAVRVEPGGPVGPAAEALHRLCVPIDPENANPLIRALQDGRSRRLAGAPQEDEFAPAFEAGGGEGPFLVLPVVLNGHARGLFLLHPAPERDSGGGRLPLAEAIARCLAQALERIETADAAEQRLARLRGLGETARSILAATNLPDVLTWATRSAVRLVDAERGLLWTYAERESSLQLAVHLPGRDPQLDAALAGLIRLAESCVLRGVSSIYPDLRQVEGLELGAAPEPIPAVAQPLLAFGDLLGVLVVIRARGPEGPPPRAFTPEEEDLLAVVAGYAAVSIRNAQLGEAVRQAERHQREMRTELARAEKLASLGEMTTRLAHDLRNPAAAIRGFARRIERGLPKDDPRRDLTRLVAREARRIEGMLSDPLQFARQTRPRLALRSLNRIAQDAVTGARDEIQSHGIQLEEAYAEPMPELLLDSERVHLAITNILQSVNASTRRGDTLRIETLIQGERVLLEIAGSGARPRGDTVERLFVPFASSPGPGSGLGLAVAYQIVNEHGGEISVRTEAEWGTVFTVSFPIEGNRERRQGGDRRGGRDRRRRESRE